jgi:hypothetical protein
MADRTNIEITLSEWQHPELFAHLKALSPLARVAFAQYVIDTDLVEREAAESIAFRVKTRTLPGSIGARTTEVTLGLLAHFERTRGHRAQQSNLPTRSPTITIPSVEPKNSVNPTKTNTRPKPTNPSPQFI